MRCRSWIGACLTGVGLPMHGKVGKGMKLAYETAIQWDSFARSILFLMTWGRFRDAVGKGARGPNWRQVVKASNTDWKTDTRKRRKSSLLDLWACKMEKKGLIPGGIEMLSLVLCNLIDRHFSLVSMVLIFHGSCVVVHRLLWGCIFINWVRGFLNHKVKSNDLRIVFFIKT